jgi:hypothetical protein
MIVPLLYGDILLLAGSPSVLLTLAILIFSSSGFTAWSSTREPSQVFTLLETIYRSFDAIAKKRRVFKVCTMSEPKY